MVHRKRGVSEHAREGATSEWESKRTLLSTLRSAMVRCYWIGGVYVCVLDGAQEARERDEGKVRAGDLGGDERERERELRGCSCVVAERRAVAEAEAVGV